MRLTKFFGGTIFLMFILLSCEQKESFTPESTTNETFSTSEIKKIRELGYEPDMAKKVGQWVIVGDVAFYTGESIPNPGPAPKPILKQEGAMVDLNKHFVDDESDIVDIVEVSNITYFIHPSVNNHPNGTDYRNAIIQAADEWTNIDNCVLSFTQTANQVGSDITIWMESSWPLGNIDALAVATLPNNGNVTLGIGINDDINFTFEGLLGTMRHEFAHIVGIRHTDENPARPAEFVRCTPDNPSIMPCCNGSATGERFMGDGDRNVARFLYPATIAQPSLSIDAYVDYEEYGYLRWDVRWNQSRSGDPITFAHLNDVEEEVEFEDGTVIVYRSVANLGENVCEDPSWSFLLFDDEIGNNKCYRWRIRGRNRKGDVTTAWTPWTQQECLSD